MVSILDDKIPVYVPSQMLLTDKVVVTLSTSKVLPLIEKNELETEEIQNIIDVLNKQKDSSGWIKKYNPVAITKKKL